MSWLQDHLENFVKPVLGYIPARSKDHARIFTPDEMCVIKNMWRSVKTAAKQARKPLLLAGRDVFIFEILARREGYPTVFRPDISRLTVGHIKENYRDHFLFDTGFMGSIPRMLGCESYTMGSSSTVALATKIVDDPFVFKATHLMLKLDTHQVFPRLTGARGLILKIERTPKYWKRAYYRDRCTCGSDRFERSITRGMCAACGKYLIGITGIGQDYAETQEFLGAALLTIDVYTDSSPAFIEKPQGLGKHVSGMLGLD